ncbi:MAG: hypothetical protein HY855_23685 [Burkholderiales bacterium]|nr:hypothetical protein [Burkholderiales bacterium]
MKTLVCVLQNTTPQHVQRLVALQHAFAAVCNALAPLVQQTRCWNRVALHHMAYKQMRQQFPSIGSQMVCNAIYSVSRSCRIVYQHPQSPFNIARLGDKALPRLHFLPQSPVYFDRHTLSIKDGQVSMYTLDGRMRFQLDLSVSDENRFRTEKLREIVLSANKAGAFQLSFSFAEADDADAEPADLGPQARSRDAELPEYVLVTHDDPALPMPAMAPRPDNARLPT